MIPVALLYSLEVVVLGFAELLFASAVRGGSKVVV